MANSSLERYKQYIKSAADEEERTYFPFSLLRLNHIIGDMRGVRSGRFIQIIGDPSTGKTTLCLDLIANAQKLGYTCAYIDFERTFDKTYAEQIGVDTSKLFLVKTDTAEDGMNIVEDMIKSHVATVIVIDSIPAAVPSVEYEKDMSDNEKMAASAGLWTRFIKRIVPMTDNHNALVVMINQYRANISSIARIEKKPYGAKQISYQSSLNLELSRVKNTEQRTTVQVKASKNKLGAERGMCEYDIIYGKGIDTLGEVIAIALDYDIISKRGAWYEWNGIKANGVEQCKEKFDVAAIKKEVQTKMI